MGSIAINEGSLYCKYFLFKKILQFLFVRECFHIFLTNRLIQVFYQIIRVFNANTESDKAITSIRFLFFLLWEWKHVSCWPAD